jgi:TetR/AcrR family transcriptional regulator, repressor of fatR-cypB operon
MKHRKSFDANELAAIDPHIRDRIETAVLDLFSQQEFHKVKLGELAARAGTSLQTIYKYYGGKDALVFATLDRKLAELAGRVHDHLHGIENYKDRLHKVYWVVLEFFEQNEKVARMIHTSVYSHTWISDVTFRQPELTRTFMKVLAEGRKQGVLTDEVDQRVLLDFFLGVVGRVVHMYLARDLKYPPTREANASFEMLWRALAKPQDKHIKSDAPKRPSSRSRT